MENIKLREEEDENNGNPFTPLPSPDNEDEEGYDDVVNQNEDEDGKTNEEDLSNGNAANNKARLTQGDRLNKIKARKQSQSLGGHPVERLRQLKQQDHLYHHSRVKSVPTEGILLEQPQQQRTSTRRQAASKAER